MMCFYIHSISSKKATSNARYYPIASFPSTPLNPFYAVDIRLPTPDKSTDRYVSK
jgi:hypothetical protein